MNVWKKYLRTILFALTGVLFLVPTVKDLIQGSQSGRSSPSSP